MPSQRWKSGKPWKGKTAVVCGASSGLGREIALQLADSQVASLALLARNGQRLEELQERLVARHPGTRVLIETADVCNQAQIAASAEKIHLELGQPHLVVQAVGRSDRGQLIDLDSQHLQSLIDTNVVSSLNALQTFRPQLSAHGGTIVLIGSLASLFAPRFLGGYPIAKHALAALAQQARLELAGEGLHVLLACPGPIARADSGTRYAESPQAARLPEEALRPGGGAKVRGLDPCKLARDILQAAAKKKKVIIRPRTARLLLALTALSPSLGDFLLQQKTS